jgi:hypothetical protein
MDKAYILATIEARINILRKRIICYNSGTREDGTEITKGVADTYRAAATRDLRLLLLLAELVSTSTDRVTYGLSEEALKGLEQLMDPCERHRSVNNGV